ncbi:GGDEF domain-containing protein [Oricola indica]|jgi:diguanylate cyclase|uniref:GGDEF domain-containing protein n=1 Tax=Oricola indica TaxID=2872591 RepID=UPI001CBED935|nr:GGDEF domain-containing protein [Oricola indica]
MLQNPKRSHDDKRTEDTGAPADLEFERAVSLSSRALRYAETYKTPPTPKNFDVWYAFASGRPEALCREISEIIEKDGSIDSYELSQLHSEYLATGETERRQQEMLGYHLDREMDKAMQRVHSHLATNEHYSGSLKRGANELSAAATPAQVRKTVEVLMMENARMRAESVKLNRDLEQTRVQVRKLRTSLEKSRENEFRDPLTNVSNRRYFERALTRLVTETRSTGNPLCLVMADIDHFKRINDTFGHQVGDDVLKYFAALLMKNVKGQDLVARYGGEEFCIILPSTTIGNAQRLITHIMAQLDSANLVMSRGKDPIGKVTSSFGIAHLQPGETGDQLVQRADARLYQAKHAGRNRVICDPSA